MQLKNFDVDKMNLTEADLKMNFKQKVLLGFMVFGIIFLLASMVLPDDSIITAFYNKVGSTWIWIVLFAILCMVRDKEGKLIYQRSQASPVQDYVGYRSGGRMLYHLRFRHCI